MDKNEINKYLEEMKQEISNEMEIAIESNKYIELETKIKNNDREYFEKLCKKFYENIEDEETKIFVSIINLNKDSIISILNSIINYMEAEIDNKPFRKNKNDEEMYNKVKKLVENKKVKGLTEEEIEIRKHKIDLIDKYNSNTLNDDEFEEFVHTIDDFQILFLIEEERTKIIEEKISEIESKESIKEFTEYIDKFRKNDSKIDDVIIKKLSNLTFNKQEDMEKRYEIYKSIPFVEQLKLIIAYDIDNNLKYTEFENEEIDDAIITLHYNIIDIVNETKEKYEKFEKFTRQLKKCLEYISLSEQEKKLEQLSNTNFKSLTTKRDRLSIYNEASSMEDLILLINKDIEENKENFIQNFDISIFENIVKKFEDIIFYDSLEELYNKLDKNYFGENGIYIKENEITKAIENYKERFVEWKTFLTEEEILLMNSFVGFFELRKTKKEIEEQIKELISEKIKNINKEKDDSIQTTNDNDSENNTIILFVNNKSSIKSSQIRSIIDKKAGKKNGKDLANNNQIIKSSLVKSNIKANYFYQSMDEFTISYYKIPITPYNISVLKKDNINISNIYLIVWCASGKVADFMSSAIMASNSKDSEILAYMNLFGNDFQNEKDVETAKNILLEALNKSKKDGDKKNVK